MHESLLASEFTNQLLHFQTIQNFHRVIIIKAIREMAVNYVFKI